MGKEEIARKHPLTLYSIDRQTAFENIVGKEEIARKSPLTLHSIDRQTAFENMVGKEEIARNEQFLLFPQCFLLIQKTVSSFFNIFDIISLFAAELEQPKIGM